MYLLIKILLFMPLPAIVAPLIGAGASILGNAVGAVSQGNMNRKNRAFAKEMYGLQRADSLADWEMQNSYNSPKEQMARLREAKLNPNLVYGHGADATSGPVRSSSASVPEGRAYIPDFSGVSDSMLSYYDIKMKNAQMDNLAQQRDVMQADAALKAAQTVNTLSAAEGTQFDTGLKKDLRETSVQAAKAALDKTLADTTYVLDNNERQTALASANIAEAAERILTSRLNRTKTELEKDQIRAQIRSIRADVRLKEMGINPNDPTWMRVLAQTVDPSGVKNWIKSDKKTSWPSEQGKRQVDSTNNPWNYDSTYQKYNGRWK